MRLRNRTTSVNCYLLYLYCAVLLLHYALTKSVSTTDKHHFLTPLFTALNETLTSRFMPPTYIDLCRERRSILFNFVPHSPSLP